MKVFCIFLITLSLIFVPTVFSQSLKLDLGEVIPKKLLRNQPDPPMKIQTLTATFDSLLRIEINEVFYSIGYNASTREITYVNTSDLEFATKAGLKVGSELDLDRQQITYYKDWEVYGPISSDGWKPVIGYNRQPKSYLLDSGETYLEPNDPMIQFEKCVTARFRVLSFSKSR